MDNIPPSYSQATTRDYWSIVSSFVRSKDLCSASLVCRQWNTIFVPHLWGNPASHFGTENDAVYVALVRFKRTLSWARAGTRELTHTLHLPPAHAELYDGPRAEWLRDILGRLPRLQSLLVTGLPFFDHGALMNLGENLPSQASPHPGLIRTYNLRLLDASNCFNLTSAGLAHALKHLPGLIYLDLSGTSSARDPAVLSALKYAPRLQVLKLRGLGLKDEDLQIASQTLGLKVRSLDVRENRLTDQGIDALLSNCFTTPGRARATTTQNLIDSGLLTPSVQLYFGGEIPQVYQTESQDAVLRRSLTTGFVNHLGIEDALGTGLTHLYLSGNLISAYKVADLLRSKRLHVLDVGDIRGSGWKRSSAVLNPTPTIPGFETLLLSLEEHGETLSHLRIPVDVVTRFVDPTEHAFPELSSDTMSGAGAPIEVDAQTQEIHELPAPIVHEFPGDSEVFELEGSAVPRITKTEDTEPKSAQGNDIEPSENLPQNLFAISPKSTSPLVSPLAPGFLLPSPTNRMSPSPETGSPRKNEYSGRRTYSGILDEHNTRVSFRKSQPHALLPSQLPGLQTLVLTGVPTHFPSREISDRLAQFVRDCADEAYWSRLQSRHAYALPPGRDRRTAEKGYAKSLFGLQNLVLEMQSQLEPPVAGTSPGGRSPNAHQPSKSSVEDPDCEELWAAASSDFSFFGLANEECGLPDNTTVMRVPLEARMGKMMVEQPNQEESIAQESMQHQTHVPARETVDVLGELSKFRRDKKAQYQQALARKESNPFVSGYWDGDITIMRP